MCGFPGTVTVTIILILMYCAVTQISIESFYLFFRSLLWFSDPTYKSIKWQPKAAVWYFVSLFIFVFMFGVVNIKKYLILVGHNLNTLRRAQFSSIQWASYWLCWLQHSPEWYVSSLRQALINEEKKLKPKSRKFFPKFLQLFHYFPLYNLSFIHLSFICELLYWHVIQMAVIISMIVFLCPWSDCKVTKCERCPSGWNNAKVPADVTSFVSYSAVC